MNRKLALVAMLALVGLLAAGCMGSSNRSARTAAIGSSTPVTGAASLTFTSSSLGTQPAFAVQKWAWGLDVQASFGGTTGGLSAGKPQFKEFTITKNIDNVSPTLYKLAAMGTHLSTMTFKVGTLLTYTFANAIVTGIDQSGSAADGNEDVSFIFSKLTTANAASGTTVSYCFDVVLNSSC